MRLEIMPIPKSIWGINLRNKMGAKAWAIYRNNIYKKFNYTCQICGYKSKHPKFHNIHAHELWQITDDVHESRLKEVSAVCKYCHNCIHIFNSIRLGFNIPKLIQHFCQVNCCDEAKWEELLEAAKLLQQERNKWQYWVAW